VGVDMAESNFYLMGLNVIILFIINALRNNNRNSFLLRLIVALVASWLLIGISDDFVASQIFIGDMLPWITGISFTIVVAILFLECREHSPYYFRRSTFKECNIKIIPIFSFAIFLSLFIGIIVQFATFQSLIQTNNVLPAVKFSSNFTAIENCKSNTQLLINNMEAYKNEVLILEHSSKKKSQNTDSLLLNNRMKTVKEMNSSKLLLSAHDSLLIAQLSNNSITKNVYVIDSLLPELNAHINALYDFQIKYCNTDSLLKVICTNDSLSLLRNKDKMLYENLIYNKFFPTDAKNEVCVKISNTEYYLFPRMLVFHACIVLLIAFIVQILVSGKTVTEGL
jgi:hypothetical protein